MHLRILISTIFILTAFLLRLDSASAQKVLQCAPGTATVNSNLQVGTNINPGDLTVSRDTTVKNNLTVERDIFAASGSQKIYLGPDAASPYISNNLLNSGEGILFYSNGGDDFLWQSPSGDGPDAMILRAGGGLPNNNNNYNLQVHGKVSSYQLHTLGIHLDMQSGIGPTRQNILKITNSDNAGSGFGAAVFHGANNWQANTDDNLIFSGLTNPQDIGVIGLTMNTVNGNVGIKTVNPQITLAIGDNDTGLKWNSDGNFSIYADNSERININAATNRISIIAPNELCLGGSCISSWPSSPTITLTGDVTGSGTTSIATTIQSGAVDWTELSGIPVPAANCSGTGKLTWSSSAFVCAPDEDTNTDSQNLSFDSNTNILSISGGTGVTLPAGASGDITSVVAGTNLTGGGASGDVTLNVANSPTFSGDLIVQGNTTLGDASTDTTTVNGSLVINKPCNGGFIRAGNMCMASGMNGNDGVILIKSVLNTGSADYAAADANFATLDIPAINGTSAKFAIVRALCDEARIYVRKVGSTAGAYWTANGDQHPEQTILCSAGNNSADWSSYGNLYYIELDSNNDIQWSLDATDSPTMTAQLYLAGYID